MKYKTTMNPDSLRDLIAKEPGTSLYDGTHRGRVDEFIPCSRRSYAAEHLFKNSLERHFKVLKAEFELVSEEDMESWQRKRMNDFTFEIMHAFAHMARAVDVLHNRPMQDGYKISFSHEKGKYDLHP